MSGDLVLVTGASGYIAAHVVQILQQQGYRVRGTVRSLENDAKVKPLYELCPDAKHPLELVETNLLDDESWVLAVEGCKYVIHVACPNLSENPADEYEVINPAVNGTLAVLKACGESVKRVVLTSSVAAVNGWYGVREEPWNEEDWTDLEKITDPQTKAKTQAERAAWDYLENLPEEKKFEMAVINPGLVFGPVLGISFTASMEVPAGMLRREYPGNPKYAKGMVDVRDVALAHVYAMEIPEAAGNRHILVTETLTMNEVAHILDLDFKDQGYDIPNSEMPNLFVRVMSIVDKKLKMIVDCLDKKPIYDNTRMKMVLGICPRSMKSTLNDMAYSMIEARFVKKQDNYKGPKYSE